MTTDLDPLVRLSALAREQAALRRVAMLVARDAEPARIFRSVCEEVGCILGVTTTNLVRFEDSGVATIVGAWAEEGAPVSPSPRTSRWTGTPSPRMILRTGRPVRIDDYTDLDDELAGRLRGVGIRSAVGAPIVVAGRLWGAMIAASGRPGGLPPDAEERLTGFAQLITDALASADAREQLAASRTRILQAGYEERRRLGRDLHDGAQQELVSVVDQPAARPESAGSASRAGRGRSSTTRSTTPRPRVHELRNLAAGIHPSVLSDRGLVAALETLAVRSPVPVELDADLDDRLPMPVETTAYFVVAEALTNVAKYARATYAEVGVHLEDGHLSLDVRDDGVGGADAAAGSGLRGLADRVSALHGALSVCSPPGRGTHLHAEIAVN